MNTEVQKDKIINLHTILVVAGLFIFALSIIVKLIGLYINGDKYRQLIEENTIKEFVIEPNRGNLYSDDGSLLATSVTRYDIHFDAVTPSKKDFDTNLKPLSDSLSKIFNKPASHYVETLKNARNRKVKYLLIGRGLGWDDCSRIKKLPLFSLGGIRGGLIVEGKTSREYPLGAIAHRIVGYDRTDDQGNVFPFLERSAGVYKNTHFSPALQRKYQLSILYNGKRYEAADTLKEVPQLTQENVTQTHDGGINRDEIMLHLRFDADPTDKNNFVLRIKASSDGVTRLYGFDERYFSDGHFFTEIVNRSSDEKEKFKKGDTVEITLFRVSENYMNFIEILSNNSADNAGLFSIPNRVKGNVVNIADPTQNPLGAFRVSQYSKIVYTIE